MHLEIGMKNKNRSAFKTENMHCLENNYYILETRFPLESTHNFLQRKDEFQCLEKNDPWPSYSVSK